MTRNNSQKSNQIQPSDPEEVVLELYKLYGYSFKQYLWPLETARWTELVFCLLTSIAETVLSPEQIREVVRTLAQKNLLSVDILKNCYSENENRRASNPFFITIMTFLQQSGFTEDEAKKAVISISEAAQSFASKYEGKVQKFFRKYGTLMLEELLSEIPFSNISEVESTRAFASWLQNTLNMPLPSSNPIVDSACIKLKIDYSSLVSAADRLDLNVALLDDVIRTYWRDTLELKEKESLPMNKQAE